MSEFKVIETQEELNAIIQERVARERSSVTKQFDGYISPDDFNTKVQSLNDQITGLTAQVTEADNKYKELEKSVGERDAQIKKYETAAVKSRIAHEVGLPYELIDRLAGESEDDIRADAVNLQKIFTAQNVPPLKNNEPTPKDSTDAAYASLLNSLVQGD